MSKENFVALTRCFFCGEGKDVLLHRRFGNLSHVHDKVLDHEPCQQCAEHMKQGVILITVRDGDEGDNPYRTGGYFVVKDEAIKRMVKPAELAEQILQRRMCYLPDSAARALGFPPPSSLERQPG